MRIRLQKHLVSLPVRYFDRSKAGSLSSNVLGDSEGLRDLFGSGLFEFAGGVISAAAAAILMFRIDVGMTMLTLFLILLYTSVTLPKLRKIRPMFRERARLWSLVGGRLTEVFSGIRIVKGFHAERRTSRAFARGSLGILRHMASIANVQAKLGVSSALFAGALSVLLMLIGGRALLEGTLSVGNFFAYILYVGVLVLPASSLAGLGSQLASGLGSLERIQEILREEPETRDAARHIQIGRVRGNLLFQNVSFAYVPGKPVLHEVSFFVDAGTISALVGRSGAGKSTMISLIAAFMNPTEGRIFVDGIDLTSVTLDSYRRQLGVVWQDNFLFDGSIKENILFGRPRASQAEMLKAAEAAYVHEFAEQFPQGYDTIIGERGVRLSGGQRQRVAIARAILADPRILLLDEATSNMDTESEAYLQRALYQLMKDRTSVVIAHRLSTVRNADQILVLDSGRLVERGSHAELMVPGKRYWQLCSPQDDGVPKVLYGEPQTMDLIGPSMNA
jgi:subfamily B ATP-binding cassette protein MsbA